MAFQQFLIQIDFDADRYPTSDRHFESAGSLSGPHSLRHDDQGTRGPSIRMSFLGLFDSLFSV
jgi:hypothetical protein